MKTPYFITLLFVLPAMVAGCASNPPATSAPLKGLSKSDPVYKYVDAMRDDLSRGKVEIINDVMQLSAAESKVGRFTRTMSPSCLTWETSALG